VPHKDWRSLATTPMKVFAANLINAIGIVQILQRLGRFQFRHLATTWRTTMYEIRLGYRRATVCTVPIGSCTGHRSAPLRSDAQNDARCLVETGRARASRSLISYVTVPLDPKYTTKPYLSASCTCPTTPSASYPQNISTSPLPNNCTQPTRCTEHTACARLARLRRRRSRTHPLLRRRQRLDGSSARLTLVRHAVHLLRILLLSILFFDHGASRSSNRAVSLSGYAFASSGATR
jgi:hypothetical protein